MYQNISNTANIDPKVLDFFKMLHHAWRRILILDYDVTIAGKSSDPTQAIPSPETQARLDWIQYYARTRLVMVTERRAAEVSEILGMKRVEVWGRCGAERLRADGVYESYPKRTAPRDQGFAVSTILSEVGRHACIAYLGNDDGAFSALKGRGLRVLVRDQFRPSDSDVWIGPSDGVAAFLGDWSAACEGNQLGWRN